ncbi:MAG TPA: chromosome segregation protein SMC [Pirellulales bacterium]|jgi:chromosome segregation protein|nr:chromosome segregation protein SMC [Pirellulales bacterium]
MLKALELVGFKSFADKTRFEFPQGITVVVGPNGSGKSNVVDAIKWVLGEQSVKSLRGKEMADVIFNGSATRKPLNTAETTLVFDNSDGRLPIDAPEVHISRRVYRSGEGEYLINRQPSRLRDIRDLFAGTGAATEAYSVIEQGKVDVLLQASPRDRRVIFEEAAGISRFKAKKIEALRRLDRVEQNLLRLSDIVDEVEGRLRTVRQQASKARRYKELADRLQELRIQVGWADWRQLTERLTAAEAEIASLRDEAQSANSQAETIEARALELETEMAELDRLIRTSEARITENRERLAALESTIEHERSYTRDLDEQSARHRQHLASLNVRVGDVEGQMQAAVEAAADAQERQRQASSRLADHERALTALTAQLDQVRNENEQRRVSFLAETRAAATLTTEIGSLESQLARAESARETCRAQQAGLENRRRLLQTELADLEARQRQLADQFGSRAAALTAAQNQLIEGRRRQTQRQKELAKWRERRAAAAERSRVLTELENRLEGVGAGVREVLALAKTDATGPFARVRGMLADLLNVDVQFARFIELALGEKAQHLVVSPAEPLLAFLAAETRSFQGRVGFLMLGKGQHEPGDSAFEGREGVIGRAERFVQVAPEYRPLIGRLLDRTWIVASLAQALRLAPLAQSGTQFVSLGGEMLLADGTLTVGPLQAASGLISRRSELRALAQQIAEFDKCIREVEGVLASLENQLARQDVAVVDLTSEHQRAAEAFAEGRMQLSAAAQQHTQLEQQIAALVTSRAAAEREWETISASLAAARARLDERQASLAQAESRISDNVRRIAELDEGREIRNRETMAAKVELARSEQQLEHLRAQLRQFEQDRRERHGAIADGQEQLAHCVGRIRESEERILTAECQLAELYLRKEAMSGETVALNNRRESLRQERTTAADEAQRHRARVRKLDEKLHKRELIAGELNHERGVLVDRLREDYGIELNNLSEPTAEESRERAVVEEEIADLRRKLANIGNVNLDSLHEADELEARFASLSTQFQDLTKAKSSLQQIVGKINADSRRLFAETLETVKGHFQELFRKLFGGGQADIVLEEGTDILDTGIEIVARPPGKEPRNISLLSGGEKTLTCVALLLAIFRSRPSPFCVLDEVDAALDEANTERFVGVLTEFLAWTRFIVVTHSKKTMTAANTLYGITMQESGVSKRVSVRFEDVRENGEIREDVVAAPDRPAANDDSDQRRAA